MRRPCNRMAAAAVADNMAHPEAQELWHRHQERAIMIVRAQAEINIQNVIQEVPALLMCVQDDKHLRWPLLVPCVATAEAAVAVAAAAQVVMRELAAPAVHMS